MNKAALLAALVASTACADGSEQHDGFYLRMHLGGSYFSGSTDAYNATIKGGGGTFGIAVGGAVADNWIVYGEAFDDIAVDPKLESDSGEVDLNGNFGIAGYGAGVAHYFMPLNLYLAGALDAAAIVVEAPNGDRARTKFGLGVNLMIGKEWWVSDNWGLGIAGQLVFAGGMKDEADASFRATAFGIVFSATYN
jgi:hypothetical protein